jgi:AraC-like DNA-binding protein
MTQNILIVLSICIVVQLSLLIVFLVTSKKGKKPSNILLASFFFLLIVNLADGILAYAGVFTRYPNLAHLEDGFVFLFGPVLFLYTLSIIYRDFHFHPRQLLHAIPFLVLTILYQVYYHKQSADEQLKIQNAIINRTLPLAFYVSVFIIYLHVCAYVALAFYHLRIYRKKIRETFSSINQLNLEWLAFMLGGFAFLLLISFVYTFLPAVGLTQLFDPLFVTGFIFIFFFSISVVWRGLRQPEIFAGIEQQDDKSEKKYASTIKEDERSIALTKIKELMEAEKIFLDPDLTLEKMAMKTPFSPKRLSQLINDSYQQNFFEFINSFRIREAERIFQTSRDRKLTVLEVMYSCGFNSKSSFNTIFKQKTGKTPSDYRKGLN